MKLIGETTTCSITSLLYLLSSSAFTGSILVHVRTAWDLGREDKAVRIIAKHGLFRIVGGDLIRPTADETLIEAIRFMDRNPSTYLVEEHEVHDDLPGFDKVYCSIEACGLEAARRSDMLNTYLID